MYSIVTRYSIQGFLVLDSVTETIIIGIPHIYIYIAHNILYYIFSISYISAAMSLLPHISTRVNWTIDCIYSA